MGIEYTHSQYNHDNSKTSRVEELTEWQVLINSAHNDVYVYVIFAHSRKQQPINNSRFLWRACLRMSSTTRGSNGNNCRSRGLPGLTGSPVYSRKHETLAQRWFFVGPTRRRWANSKPTLGQRLMLAGKDIILTVMADIITACSQNPSVTCQTGHDIRKKHHWHFD